MDPASIKDSYDQSRFLDQSINRVGSDVLQSQFAQSKAAFDQTQYLGQGITKVDSDLLQSQYAQSKAAFDQTQYLGQGINKVDTDLLKSQFAQSKDAYDQTQFLGQQINKVDSDLFKSQFAQSQELLSAGERSGFASEQRQNRNADKTVQYVNDTARNNFGAIERVGKDAVLATERVGAHLDTNIYRTTAGLDANIYRTSAATDVAVYRTTQDIKDEISRLALDGHRNLAEVQGIIKDNSDQAWGNYNNTTRDLLNGKAETYSAITSSTALLAKQNSENSTIARIEAMKNKEDLTKQMAFQYIDIKDKISASEASIKDVLRVQETDRLRDTLRATEHKSLYFELKNQGHHGRHHGGHHRGHHGGH